jgi:protein-tyrosine phosphatase
MLGDTSTSQRVLFLCSGNYYRSRFAEILFNDLAAGKGLSWRAFSRGLVADRPNGNEGPISPHALLGLKVRGIQVPRPVRFPLQLQVEELEAADLVIAVKKGEHRPVLAERFPGWQERVEYWYVDDLDCATPAETLGGLESLVRELLERLA